MRRAGHRDAGDLLVGHVEQVRAVDEQLEARAEAPADAGVEQHVVERAGRCASGGGTRGAAPALNPPGSGIAAAATNECGA